ncbi:MAG: lysophospholipid acyltransferase family protein [Pirellulales bacterium]
MTTTAQQPAAKASKSKTPFKRSLAKRLWYRFMRVFLRLGAVAIYRLRWWGREHIPATGGVLILSNHQSHIDPPLLGLCIDRRINYLARDTLFRFPPFRWLINSLDAIPIDREGLGLAGLKETLKRLKRGELVLIFPEGTRSPDGEVAPLKPGFSALARRAGVPLLPVAIDGAYQAWPRQQKYPGRGVIHVQFGPPLWPEELDQYDERELVEEVERRIRDCHAAARRHRKQCRLGASRSNES